MTPLGLNTRYQNLNNNLLKELKRYYAKNNLQEPARPTGEVYYEELALIERLNLNFASVISFNIGSKPFPAYLTNLKEVTIKRPCRVSLDFLKNIPNKQQITKLVIDGTDFVSLDLSEFPNLTDLEIVNNEALREVKGLENIQQLEYISFYNNQLVDEEHICKFLAECMEKNAEVKADILYYKRITSLIRKEYSKYSESFRETKWIEAIAAGLKDRTTLEHTTVQTGKFYSKLNDILNEILPRSGVDDLEAIYLIYSWIVKNVSYDHEGLKNKLKMHTVETTLNFGDRVQKIKMASGMVGGTNGAFNAIYGKTVVCQGFTKVMQMFLKAYDYDIKTLDEDAYGEVDPTKPVVPLKQLASRGKSPINHSILRIILEGRSFFCDATNERVDSNGNVLQTKFMKTFEELTSRWYPVTCPYPGTTQPLTEEERKHLSRLRLQQNKPYNQETKATRMMERFNLHITGEAGDLILETEMKKREAEDLLLLGFINEDVLRIIQGQQSTEYLRISAEKAQARKR